MFLLSHSLSLSVLYITHVILNVDNKIQDPFLNIAPKKPNWDLRRDVQKKLDKLERRTQKAMLVLMGMSSFFVLLIVISYP